MLAQTNIKFLEHQQIDKVKYDECIVNSANSLIYARSFYLDIMCPHWSAVIAEDYSWVMPITWNKKWGIKYLYQPPFTQQLGLFKRGATAVPYEQVIQLLQRQFRFWEINLNYQSLVKLDKRKFNVFTCANFIINLKEGYEKIESGYHKDLIKNLKRSKKFNLQYRSTNNYTTAINEYISHYSNRMKHVTVKDYSRFKLLCKILSERTMLLCREVVNDKDELLAVVLCLQDERRIYNLMNTTTAIGRKLEANHFLMDSLIKEFAGSELMFDFEGSDLIGVKTFYENFGAINQPYFKVTYNNLPWPLKLLK
jgi:hypothetical protein